MLAKQSHPADALRFACLSACQAPSILELQAVRPSCMMLICMHRSSFVPRAGRIGKAQTALSDACLVGSALHVPGCSSPSLLSSSAWSRLMQSIQRLHGADRTQDCMDQTVWHRLVQSMQRCHWDASHQP